MLAEYVYMYASTYIMYTHIHYVCVNNVKYIS